MKYLEYIILFKSKVIISFLVIPHLIIVPKITTWPENCSSIPDVTGGALALWRRDCNWLKPPVPPPVRLWSSLTTCAMSLLGAWERLDPLGETCTLSAVSVLILSTGLCFRFSGEL